MSIGRKLTVDKDGHLMVGAGKVPAMANSGKARTKQSFRDQCDINHIMSRYLRSGTVDHLAKHGGSYGEISPLTFHEAMNVVAKATEMFNDLPSKVRQRFGGDPALFLNFVQERGEDGGLKNISEMRTLGLALPVKEPPPRAGSQPAPAAPGAAAAAPAGLSSAPAAAPSHTGPT